MSKRVAIVEVAQLPGTESGDTFLHNLIKSAGRFWIRPVCPEDMGTVISASSDVFHGGNPVPTPIIGMPAQAFSRAAAVRMASLFAFQYGYAYSGWQFDTALILGVCKGFGESAERMHHALYTDPFYQRHMGSMKQLRPPSRKGILDR